MEYSRKHAKYIQKYPENKENIQKMSKNMSKKYPKNIQKIRKNNQKSWKSWKKTAEHKIPHMASKKKVLQQKCPPRTKNSDYGVIVA